MLVWDLKKGEVIRRLGEVQAVHSRFSLLPRDSVIATGGTLQGGGGHSSAVMAVVFTPDGKSVISAAAEKKLIQWDVDVRQSPLHSLPVLLLPIEP